MMACGGRQLMWLGVLMLAGLVLCEDRYGGVQIKNQRQIPHLKVNDVNNQHAGQESQNGKNPSKQKVLRDAAQDDRLRSERNAAIEKAKRIQEDFKRQKQQLHNIQNPQRIVGPVKDFNQGKGKAGIDLNKANKAIDNYIHINDEKKAAKLSQDNVKDSLNSKTTSKPWEMENKVRDDQFNRAVRNDQSERDNSKNDNRGSNFEKHRVNEEFVNNFHPVPEEEKPILAGNNMFHQTEEARRVPERKQPAIGGIRVNWDWEDFSITFDNYGGAEMKVRRAPHPTNGEPWPMPQYYTAKAKKVMKLSKDLRFVNTGKNTCDILEEALSRHLQRTLRGAVEDMYDNLQHAEGTFIDDPSEKYDTDEYLHAPTITRVEIQVVKPCDKFPSLESDESYDLIVKKRKTYIRANEVWGLLRGLETFGQLVWIGTDGLLYIKETGISDYPRFPHRGLHIDTSRHYLFKDILLDILDSMEMNKLNVMHWHIVDDQSFPYESKVYPELSRKGAFHPSYVYTLEDIAEIIEYARIRGIRVVPEFDTPGHTYAWGLSRPELLTQCYSGNIPVKGYLGPIDPSKNSTYRFLQTLFQEIMDVFKDQFIHLGGDEVPLGCWQSNPEVMAFANELKRKMRKMSNRNNDMSMSMWSEEIKRVYEYYENRLMSILTEIGRKRKKGVRYVMWQEVMNNDLQLPNNTIIQVWIGDMQDVNRAISLGYDVLYSTCWYLDHVEYGTKWPKYYNCDPADQSYGYTINEKKVLGGEVAFWSEYFSNENLIPLMWPRASAAAERLWSSKDVKNLDKAAERLSEHRCRMIKRGINAGEISGPGYCLHSPFRRRNMNESAGCKGGNCSRPHIVQIEDFDIRLSQRGGSIADCGHVFSSGSNSFVVFLLLTLIVLVCGLAVSHSSSRLGRSRLCKNRNILLLFIGVLVVYFLCYTTIWMRVFEFSGSFHKTFQTDKNKDDQDAIFTNLGQDRSS